ncbi:MAG: hypothetical protein L0196_00330 [candidate division Zixibacteria bacterium]|nr:hypothetical protein [candidate division Zixibacteria bacterium]
MKRVLFFLFFGLIWGVSSSFANQERPFFSGEASLLAQMGKYRSLSANQSFSPDEPESPVLEPGEKKKVSTLKAVGLSVLVPGTGHWYLGRRDRARLFFGMEAAGWASFAAFLWFSNQRESDYRNFAVARAGVDPAGKDEQFWRSLTFYENRDEYNRIGRVTNLDNPFYPENAFYNWQWDSPDSRNRYRNLRNSSKTAHRRAIFTLALLGVERLVAAADAYRLSKKMNAKASTGELEVFFEPSGSGGRLVFSHTF